VRKRKEKRKEKRGKERSRRTEKERERKKEKKKREKPRVRICAATQRSSAVAVSMLRVMLEHLLSACPAPQVTK